MLIYYTASCTSNSSSKSITSTAITTIQRTDVKVSKSDLCKMNPQQVEALLRSHGVMDLGIRNRFEQNCVTGKIIAAGLSDKELEEMGFTSSIQRRGVKDVLQGLTYDDGRCMHAFAMKYH